MPVDFTIGNDSRFPPGTTLGCYQMGGRIPTGVAVDESTVQGDGSTTFTGLAYSTRYAAAPALTGPFIEFTTEEEPSEIDDLLARVIALEGQTLGENTMGTVVYDAELEEWPPRPSGAEAVIWVGPDAPSIGGATGALVDVDAWIPTIEDT